MKKSIDELNNQTTLLRIAIDGNEANVSNRVGSNVYAYEIITQLYTLVRNKNVMVTILLSAPPDKDLPPENKKWHYKIVTPQKFWTQWALPIHLYFHRDDYDVFYTPGHYAPRFSKVPYVSSVMDLAFLKFSDQFKKKDFVQLKNWTAYSVKNAKKIIAISDFTKQDIVEQYKKPPSDVVVAYPAVKASDAIVAPLHVTQTLSKFKITQPYILYVGTIQPRKNLINLITAFEKISRKLPLGKRKKVDKLQLVIAGKIGWLAEDVLKRVEESPYKNNIVLTGFISDFEKEVLLSKAETLALVGLYEGFGIPPLEALQHDLIPVVSNTSSLPEVVGSAGLLADPRKPEVIADQLETVLTMTNREKKQYLRARKTQLEKFNWKDSAKIIYKTLEKVARHA